MILGEMMQLHHLFFVKLLEIVRYLCYCIQVPYYYEEDALWS